MIEKWKAAYAAVETWISGHPLETSIVVALLLIFVIGAIARAL